MSSKRLSVLSKKLQSALKKYNIPDIPEYLTAIMAGVDPRGKSSYLYEQAAELQRLWKDIPEELLWELETRVPDIYVGIKGLIDHILTTPAYKCTEVSLGVSVAAATKMLDYLYPKYKAVEVSGELAHLVHVKPLSDEEIALVKAKFEKEY